eukprot:gene8736-8916_t
MEQGQWRQVVAVTAGCLLLCNFHRSTFSVLLPDLAEQLQLSALQAGVVQSSMLLTYLAGQVPAGRAADKHGGPSVLLCGLALWSAATALTAVAGLGVGAGQLAAGSCVLWPLAVVVGCRALMGLASACVMPCVTATAVEWVPAAERSSMIAFVYANFNVGGVAGLTLIPILAEIVGGSGAFLIAGAAGVLWAVAGTVLLRQVPQPLPGPQLPEVAALLASNSATQNAPLPQLAQEDGAASPKQQGQQYHRLFNWQLDHSSLQQLLLLLYAHAIIGFGFFLFQSFLPMYIASLGSQGLRVTGQLSSMPWLAAAVAGMMAGAAADGLIKKGLPTLFVRQLFQTLSFLGCALSVLPLAISADPGLMPAVLCLTANLVFYSLSYGGFHAYLQDVAGKHAGVVQGLTNSASIACGIAGNLLTGMVVDATGSFRIVFWVLFALYVIAAGIWIAFSQEHKLRLL